jgi:FAD/FMN-containing dehydrogenase
MRPIDRRLSRRRFLASSSAAVATGLHLENLLAAGTKFRISADVIAVSLDGDEVILPKAVVREFAEVQRGTVMLQGAAGYEESRKIWNGMIDRKPALIAQCSGAADVINAVNFARDNNLLLAVRAGGHSISGKSVCEGGLMIDLTRMNGVRVDTQRKTAWVEGGALLGAMDHEAQRFGLVTTAGTVSHTGAAGLTLGGGLGRLARMYGLTSDNLLSADIVTADGRFLRTSEDENPGLFWGLRGGGGNFGIVTALEYRLHPFGPDILGCTAMYPMDQARDVLSFINEFAPTAHRELTMSGVMIMPPNGKAIAIISATYGGDMVAGEKHLQPLLNFGKPLRATLKAENYVHMQKDRDGNLPFGRKYYLKSGYLKEIGPRFIDELVERFEPAPDRNNIVLLNQLGGAIADRASDDTAYAHRGANFDLMIGAAWDDPAQSETNVAWGRNYWKEVSSYTDGFYVNNANDETQQAVARNYEGNYKRLVKLKTEFDPANLFRLNANIKPK